MKKEAINLGEKLNEALAKIAKTNPRLDGVINRTDFNKQDEIPPDRLIKLFQLFSRHKLCNQNVAPDMLGNAYEYLLKKFNELAPARAGEFYTPREVVKVLVEILDPTEGMEVYDPCSGSGGMLIESHQNVRRRGKDPKKLFLYGQEINPDTWTISMMNVILHDMEAEVHQGDTFADPKFVESAGLKKFDIVVANPMWNQDGYRQLMENDTLGRFIYGLSPDNSADLGWIQHMLASLRQKGRLGIVLDQGALSRGGAESEIRKKLIDEDLVDCIVALPDKIFYNTPAPGCLIFLNRNKPDERKGKILFIYAARDFEKMRNMNRLRDEDIARIVKTYKDFQAVPRYSNVLSIDAVKQSYNLSVTLYVDTFEEGEPVDIGKIWNELLSIQQSRLEVESKLRAYLAELGYER